MILLIARRYDGTSVPSLVLPAPTVRRYVERNPERAGLVEGQRPGLGVVRGHACIQTIVVPYRCATGRYPVPKTGCVASTNP